MAVVVKIYILANYTVTFSVTWIPYRIMDDFDGEAVQANYGYLNVRSEEKVYHVEVCWELQEIYFHRVMKNVFGLAFRKEFEKGQM